MRVKVIGWMLIGLFKKSACMHFLKIYGTCNFNVMTSLVNINPIESIYQTKMFDMYSHFGIYRLGKLISMCFLVSGDSLVIYLP